MCKCLFEGYVCLVELLVRYGSIDNLSGEVLVEFNLLLLYLYVMLIEMLCGLGVEFLYVWYCEGGWGVVLWVVWSLLLLME